MQQSVDLRPPNSAREGCRAYRKQNVILWGSFLERVVTRVGTKVAELSLRHRRADPWNVMSLVTHHTMRPHPGQPVAQFDRALARDRRMTWLEYNEALQELRADSEVIVGTGAQATWRLRRADLMPRHFVVATVGDRVMIRPFSRDAVVTVNGRQLPCADLELHDGDIISAGSADFHFWSVAPAQATQFV